MNIPSFSKHVIAPIRWYFHRHRLQKRVAQDCFDELLAQDSGDGVIVFFAPEAGVVPHFSAHCIAARTLQDLAHKVVVLRCLEVFPRCPVMDSSGLPREMGRSLRQQVCYSCGERGQNVLSQYGLKGLDLRRFIDDYTEDRIQEILNTCSQNPIDLVYEGIPFGKLCAVDIVLSFKVINFERITEEVKVAWVENIRCALLSYFATQRIQDCISVKAFVHYNDYGIFSAMRAAAKIQNIPVINIAHSGNRGSDRRKLLISNQPWTQLSNRLVHDWSRWRELALSPSQVQEVGSDLIIRFNGTGPHVYSSPKSTERNSTLCKLKFQNDKKVIVAFTGSPDEVIATQAIDEALGLPKPAMEQIFPDHVTWIEQLIHFVEQHPELQLAVRIHPREGANKRESKTSAHYQILKERFSKVPARCRIVWPEEAISSYDLAEIADLALVSWSSIGNELARCGVPVLSTTFAMGPFPCDDFIRFAPNAHAYFELLLEMLENEVSSFETIRRAFRAYHLLYLSNTVDLADVVPSYDYYDLPEYSFPKQGKLFEQAIVHGESLHELFYLKLKANQTESSYSQETKALHEFLCRLLHFLCTGELTSETHPAGTFNNVSTLVNLGWITYRKGEGSWARYSPMAGRLARFCDQAGSLLPIDSMKPD